jgi:hypothetical protein
MRAPASPENDRHRCGVDGILFGSYASQIRQGVLSLTEKGLPTYGDVYCRLKAIAIEDRVSFLETNSYTFVKEHRLVPGGSIPSGFRSIWKNRYQLALAKLGKSLSQRSAKADWQRLLVKSDGTDRSTDDFIEAHIYGGFNVDAIEEMQRVPKGRKRNDPAEIDARMAIEEFTALKERA